MYRSLLFLIVIGLLMTGCLGGSVTFTVDPNPIVFTVEETRVDVTLNVRTAGFGTIAIDEAIVQVFDPDEEEVYDYSETVGYSGPVVPGITESVEFALDMADLDLKWDPQAEPELFQEYYDDELLGKTYILRIQLTGSSPVTSDVNLEFR